MRIAPSTIGFIGLGLLLTSCVSYSGVAKTPEGQLYISGGTDYFFFSKAWIRRCVEDGMKLECEELSESPSAPRGSGSGSSQPPATMGPAPAPSPAAPAPSGSAAPATGAAPGSP